MSGKSQKYSFQANTRISQALSEVGLLNGKTM